MARKSKKKEETENVIELDPAVVERLKEIETMRFTKPVHEVRSASLRDNLFCNYMLNHNLSSEIKNEIKNKNEVPIHDDLKAAFSKLDFHLAAVVEEIDAETLHSIADLRGDISNPEFEKASAVTFTGFKLDGDKGADGVLLIGHKRLSTGEHLPLIAPKVTFSSKVYSFGPELIIDVYGLIDEILLYMQGKRAPEAQIDLFDEADAFSDKVIAKAESGADF